MLTAPLLTALWALPLLGAAVVIGLPSSMRGAVKYLGLACSVGVLVIALTLAVRFDPAGPRYQFVESHSWIKAFGAGYTLGLDGIALALVVLTAVLMPLLLIAGWNDADHRTGLSGRGTHGYIALMLGVEAMVLLSLAAMVVILLRPLRVLKPLAMLLAVSEMAMALTVPMPCRVAASDTKASVTDKL